MGAIGWVWVVSVLRLKGRWSVVGIVLAALYCLRAGSDTLLGAGDQVVYAAAPWLLAAAMRVAERMRYGPKRGLVRQTTLLCFALGCMYWLKYSGVFMSVAVFLAVLLEHWRAPVRPRLAAALGLLSLYGAAFFLPIVGLEIYDVRRSGADMVDAAIQSNVSPPRTFTRFRLLVEEGAYSTGTALFSTEPGADRVAGVFDGGRDLGAPDVYGWLVRLPGLLLFPVLLYVFKDYSPPLVRNLAFLLIAVPFAGFPVLSFIAGPHFTFAMGRCCEPFWILLELLALLYLSQTGKPARPAGICLAVLVFIQMLLFLWMPAMALGEGWYLARRPAYRAGAANLWAVDLSRWGSREIDAAVKSQIRSPEDIIVPAVYSNRSFGMDTWLEFAGNRLLPLTTFTAPLRETHGAHGADYNSAEPFHSSRAVRVILVASDTFSQPSFRAGVDRIKSRFRQARSWTRAASPADPDKRVEIWVGEVGR